MSDKARDKLIKRHVDSMNALVVEKNNTRDRTRLGYTPGDFSISVRLVNLALKNQETTLTTVSEVLTALGAVMRTAPIAPPQKATAISAAAAPQPAPVTGSRYTEVLQYVQQHGPVKALAVTAALQYECSPHLTKLKYKGLVVNTKDGLWTVARPSKRPPQTQQQQSARIE